VKKCIVCGGNKKSKLENLRFKKLTCGHIAHVKCCEKLFNPTEETFNKCKLDNSAIFKGLSSIKIKVDESLVKVVSDKNPKSAATNNNEFFIINNVNMGSQKGRKVLPHSSGSLKRPHFSTTNLNNNNFSLALDIKKVEFNEEMDVRSFENREKQKIQITKQPRNPSVKNMKSKNPLSLNPLVDRKVLEETKQIDQVAQKARNIKVVDLKIMNFKFSPLLYEK